MSSTKQKTKAASTKSINLQGNRGKDSEAIISNRMKNKKKATSEKAKVAPKKKTAAAKSSAVKKSTRPKARPASSSKAGMSNKVPALKNGPKRRSKVKADMKSGPSTRGKAGAKAGKTKESAFSRFKNWGPKFKDVTKAKGPSKAKNKGPQTRVTNRRKG